MFRRRVLPELQLAIDDDWLDASKGPLATEQDYRKAMSILRTAVERRLVIELDAAFKRFLKAAPGQSPATVGQLAAFFDPPVDPALLARWKVEAVAPEDVEFMGRCEITRTPVDPELDLQWSVRSNGYSSTHMGYLDSSQALLEMVWAAFRASGQTLQHLNQLQAFATTPEQRAALEHWTEKFQSMSAEEQSEALRQVHRR